MGKWVAAFTLCLLLLRGEEFTPPVPTVEPKEEVLSSKEGQSTFVYFSGGLNPLPTIAFGCRILYDSFGSDIALSGSFFPIGACGKLSFYPIPIPGLMYKQLFFSGNSWEGLKRGCSAFYWGAQTGVYPIGDLTVNLGGLVGWQFKKRGGGCNFFELGVNPVLYTGRKLRLAPLASLAYAFMF